MNEERRKNIITQIEQRILDLKADQELVEGERSIRADLVRSTRPAMIDQYEIMLNIARGLGDDEEKSDACDFKWWHSGDTHTHDCVSVGEHNNHACGSCLATRVSED